MEQYSEKQRRIFQKFYENCKSKKIDPTSSEADKQRAYLLAKENKGLVQIFGEQLDGGHVDAYCIGKQVTEEKAAAARKAAEDAKIAEQRKIDEQTAALEKTISKLYGRDKRLFFLQQELDAALKNQKEVKGIVDRYVQQYERADRGSNSSSWGTMGGIAAGITGSTAVGAVVAADAMNKDANTRAQNAALKSDLLNQWPIYQSMQNDAGSRVRAARAEIEKAKLSLMEEHPLLELMDGISLGEPQVAFTKGNTMLIQVEVSAQNYQIAEVSAVLDGCFVAEIYEGEQKIGEAFLNLPRDGITTKTQMLRGHCLEARPGVSYTVLILPTALWVIEKYKFSAEVPTLNKLIPTYSKKFSWVAIPRCNVSWRSVLEARQLEAERKAEEERKAEQARKAAAAERAKKMKKIALIVTPIAVVAIIAGAIISNSMQKSSAYQDAVALMESGEYDAAVAAFEELGDYKDSAEQISNVRYTEALELVQEGRYDDAISIFTELGDYKDSTEQITNTQELQAEAELLTQYQNAIDLLNTKPGTEQYYDAVSESRKILEGLGDYRDCKALLQNFHKEIIGIRRKANTSYYLYDNKGKIIFDGSYTYTYNEDGTLASFSDSVLTFTAVSYDDDGRVLRAETDRIAYTYTYDNNGRLASKRLEGGTPNETTYTYDDEGRLIRTTTTNYFSLGYTTDSTISYGYMDENGTIISEGNNLYIMGWIYAPEKNK